MVGAKRGYTYYPAYLFDVPPKKLKIDHLRKKYLITEIARPNTQRHFYRNAMILMSHLKEFMKVFAAATLHASVNPDKNLTQDHDYAIQDSDQERASTSEDEEQCE